MLDPGRTPPLKERIANASSSSRWTDWTRAITTALRPRCSSKGDTELMSARPDNWLPKTAPTISSRSAVSRGDPGRDRAREHRLPALEDLGARNKEWLVFGRRPNEFKNPYGSTSPETTGPRWRLATACSTAPDRAALRVTRTRHTARSRRALVKVDKEEYFTSDTASSWMRTSCPRRAAR